MDGSLLVAILMAYRKVQYASWPHLHPDMATRSAVWMVLSPAKLEAELSALVDRTNQPDCSLRVFWKLGPEFVYGGCNAAFARDAGFKSPAELVGKTDFAPGIS